ncbi:hypothetical protein [Advenella alkanexedens]|uniref:hypothetical protein n=1 Tax=Advenella alkanexedens TaxID=1481665 RepID=UPI0031B88A01
MPPENILIFNVPAESASISCKSGSKIPLVKKEVGPAKLENRMLTGLFAKAEALKTIAKAPAQTVKKRFIVISMSDMTAFHHKRHFYIY